MESSNEKVELIHKTIKQLMDEEKRKITRSHDESHLAAENEDAGVHQHHHLLAKVLSQLESLREDGDVEPFKQSVDKMVRPSKVGDGSDPAIIVQDASSDIANEEIVKELKELKKQNFVTHCLLSALIVVTLVWQLSEVSLILKVKDGVSHPFRSMGGMISGMFKSRVLTGEEGERKGSAAEKNDTQHSPLPALKIPELPHLDFNENEKS